MPSLRQGAARQVLGALRMSDAAVWQFCTVCHTALDPVLPAAGYRTHPCCDPDEKPGERKAPSRA